MQLFFNSVLIYSTLLINFAKSNNNAISDENTISDKSNNESKSDENINILPNAMVLNLNIFEHNVGVNSDQNRKQIFMNSGPKALTATKSQLPAYMGARVAKYPDHLSEVKLHNMNEIFGKRISKRWDELNSLFDKKHNNDKNDKKGIKYLELSLFVDLKAYENFRTNGLIETKNDFHEMLLCYINQIQAIYAHKSFEENFIINLVKIEIQKEDMFSQTNGNRDELLKKFCEYQSLMNPVSDSDPLHWDMALLLTGYDLYVVRDDGTRDYKSLGLGSVSGICSVDRNCVISEFQPISTTGEMWPSSGLMSTWAAAHEMAHNLGILHDGWPFNIECPINGYIMSGSRGTRGETNWSECSANNFEESITNCLNDKPIVLNEKYDHNKYKSRPGVVWDADRQCKLFLRDNKAFEFPKTNARICSETIFCATPNKIGFYSSGPALEGTSCGDKSWCVDGKCQPWNGFNKYFNSRLF